MESTPNISFRICTG